MSYEPLEQLSVNLYEFARRQFRDELRNDFPRLRSIHGTRALFVTDFFRRLNAADRERLMEACLSRAHQEIAAKLEPLSQGQVELLRMFDEATLSAGANWKYIPIRSKRKYRDVFSAQGRSLPPEAGDSDFGDEFPAKLDRRTFFVELTHVLSHHWSKPMNRGAGEWELTARVGERMTSLNLDFGGTSDQLSYWHNVGPNSARFLSIGRWLGVGGLSWDLCTSADSKSVADSVAELTNEFVEAFK